MGKHQTVKGLWSSTYVSQDGPRDFVNFVTDAADVLLQLSRFYPDLEQLTHRANKVLQKGRED